MMATGCTGSVVLWSRSLGSHKGIHLINADTHRFGLAVATSPVVVMVGGGFADGYLSALAAAGSSLAAEVEDVRAAPSQGAIL
jgi:hypothetical protein